MNELILWNAQLSDLAILLILKSTTKANEQIDVLTEHWTN
jgi:hypothetical protein